MVEDMDGGRDMTTIFLVELSVDLDAGPNGGLVQRGGKLCGSGRLEADTDQPSAVSEALPGGLDVIEGDIGAFSARGRHIGAEGRIHDDAVDRHALVVKRVDIGGIVLRDVLARECQPEQAVAGIGEFVEIKGRAGKISP